MLGAWIIIRGDIVMKKDVKTVKTAFAELWLIVVMWDGFMLVCLLMSSWEAHVILVILALIIGPTGIFYLLQRKLQPKFEKRALVKTSPLNQGMFIDSDITKLPSFAEWQNSCQWRKY